MIGRKHGIALAALLGAASVSGAYATITTSNVTNSDTKPEVVASAVIAKRQARLDAWEASLRRALASKPPKLPALPHFAHVPVVGSPAYAALPAPTVSRAVPKSAPAVTKVAAPRARLPRTVPVTMHQTRSVPASRGASPGERASEPKAPAARSQPPAEPTPTVPSAPIPAPAQAPTPAPAPAATPLSQPATPTRSEKDAESQCEALKQAAEGQGEAAKREAERQCEALKHPGGGEGGDDG